MEHRRTVHFYLNGSAHDVIPASPDQTVLQYLREQLRLTGTKEGCAEGDCGACTITEASLDAAGNVQYRAINACIRFLPTVDGKSLWTVEALAGPGGRLHPAQQAMVDHHGSQCGFCTPGFVMSLYSMYRNGITRPARDEVLDHLSGNLCRCTGYRPIIDAAQAMYRYAEPESGHQQTLEQLQALKSRCASSVALDAADGRTYFAPATADELAALLLQHPDGVLLAGGTDVGLWVTKQLKSPGTIIYLGNVHELNVLRHEDEHLCIGAAVPLNDGYKAIVDEYPEAAELWKRFASMPIRNAGTLVGNLANGSPIGDTAPFLIAIGAQVILRKGNERRRLALEALYIDYRKQDREPGEFIEAVLIPLRPPNIKVASYKLAKRFDQDISAVCSAYALVLDDEKVASIRIAHGGMAATSRRAPHAEKALAGQVWDETSVGRAMAAMSDDYQPMTDMRATGAYRLRAAQNLLYRFYLESTSSAPTRV